MGEPQVQKKVTITMKADGMIEKVEGEDGQGRTVQGEEVLQPIEKKMKLVAAILHSHESPGCWYYYLPNGQCHMICF